MSFTQPTLHHILYIESDTIQIAKYGFFRPEPKSIWVEFEDESERDTVSEALMRLHRDGILKLYIVSACKHGDDYGVEDVYEELTELTRWPIGGNR